MRRVAGWPSSLVSTGQHHFELFCMWRRVSLSSLLAPPLDLGGPHGLGSHRRSLKTEPDLLHRPQSSSAYTGRQQGSRT